MTKPSNIVEMAPTGATRSVKNLISCLSLSLSNLSIYDIQPWIFIQWCQHVFTICWKVDRQPCLCAAEVPFSCLWFRRLIWGHKTFMTSCLSLQSVSGTDQCKCGFSAVVVVYFQKSPRKTSPTPQRVTSDGQQQWVNSSIDWKCLTRVVMSHDIL